MKLTRKAMRIGGLLVVTGLAIGLMGLVSTGSLRRADPADASGKATDLAVIQPIAVAVTQVSRQRVAIRDRYSGMIRPWERYALGFETAGRLESLGTGPAGGPLDDGDSVGKGQLLARLDDRVLRARESEAAARLEQATSDFDRVKKVESRQIGAVTDADVQQQLTELATAKAAHQMAVKNLEDAQLIAPVDAVISKRFVNAGESVAPHAPAFELVEIDRVLLVLGVPASDIPELQARMRQVQRNQALSDKRDIDPADLRFEVQVRPIDRNRFDQDRELTGTVYRISQTADDRTGLFEVEVSLPNRDRSLRPGMIARADVVVHQIDGWPIPTSSVVAPNTSQGQEAPGPLERFVFAFEPEPGATRVGDGPPEAELGRARRINLTRWVEQRDTVIVVDATAPLDLLIWRGQHRLTDGQQVERIPFAQPTSED